MTHTPYKENTCLFLSCHKMFILYQYIVKMKFIDYLSFIARVVGHQLECRLDESMATSGAVVLSKLSGMCVRAAVSVRNDNKQTNTTK